VVAVAVSVIRNLTDLQAGPDAGFSGGPAVLTMRIVENEELPGAALRYSTTAIIARHLVDKI
jgi:hypothetical protein